MVIILDTPAMQIAADETTGSVVSFRLYGEELLAQGQHNPDVAINGQPLDLRVAPPTWTNISDYRSARPVPPRTRCTPASFSPITPAGGLM